MKFGSITTGIVSDGLVFNMDAGNRSSYIPNATTSYNTINLSQSGSFVNDPTYVSPPTSASCWDFDGVDDCINCGDMEMNGWTGLTIEAWVKAGEDTTTERRMLSKDQLGVQGAWFLRKKDEDLEWYFNDGSWKYAIYSSYSEDLNWHHVVGSVLNGTSTLYLDGTEVASVSSVGALDDVDNEEVVIGADSDIAAPDAEWLGQIANVKIYNRGLSASEVLQNYNATKNRFP